MIIFYWSFKVCLEIGGKTKLRMSNNTYRLPTISSLESNKVSIYFNVIKYFIRITKQYLSFFIVGNGLRQC